MNCTCKEHKHYSLEKASGPEDPLLFTLHSTAADILDACAKQNQALKEIPHCQKPDREREGKGRGNVISFPPQASTHQSIAQMLHVHDGSDDHRGPGREQEDKDLALTRCPSSTSHKTMMLIKNTTAEVLYFSLEEISHNLQAIPFPFCLVTKIPLNSIETPSRCSLK